MNTPAVILTRGLLTGRRGGFLYSRVEGSLLITTLQSYYTGVSFNWKERGRFLYSLMGVSLYLSVFLEGWKGVPSNHPHALLLLRGLLLISRSQYTLACLYTLAFLYTLASLYTLACLYTLASLYRGEAEGGTRGRAKGGPVR